MQASEPLGASYAGSFQQELYRHAASIREEVVFNAERRFMLFGESALAVRSQTAKPLQSVPVTAKPLGF